MFKGSYTPYLLATSGWIFFYSILSTGASFYFLGDENLYPLAKEYDNLLGDVLSIWLT